MPCRALRTTARICACSRQGNLNSRYQAGGQATGRIWVGKFRGNLDYRWGPTAEDLDYGGETGSSRVRITYNAGFPVIPMPIQLATVELVKHQISRLRTDLLLTSERARDYAYTIQSETP